MAPGRGLVSNSLSSPEAEELPTLAVGDKGYAQGACTYAIHNRTSTPTPCITLSGVCGSRISAHSNACNYRTRDYHLSHAIARSL